MFKFGEHKNVSSFSYHKKFLLFESIKNHGTEACKNWNQKLLYLWKYEIHGKKMHKTFEFKY